MSRANVLVILLLRAGCQQVAVPADTGQSSFRFVERADAVAGKATVTAETLKTGDYYTEAKPIMPLVTPVYPAKALAAKAGLTVVGVHVTVDKEGRVSDVGPSLLAVSIPTRFDVEHIVKRMA